MRLLMANEPRAYREVIAEAVRDLRPDVEIMTVEPGEVDSHISNFRPDMVICSVATEAVKDVRVCVELYPEFRPQSVISVEGKTSEVDEIQLADLLAVVDRAGLLIHGD